MTKTNTFIHSIRLLTCTSVLIAVQATAIEQRWQQSFNSWGQPILSDGPRLSVDDSTHYTYDSAGNVSSISNALGHVTTLVDYNERGQPGLITDPNGVQVLMIYHPRGWLLSRTIVDPGGDQSRDVTTRYAYDNNGQLLTVTQPDGTSLNYEYDPARRLTSIVNSRGESIEYQLDAAGNRLRTITRSATGLITRQIDSQYDELNRLLLLSTAAGASRSYRYDKNGNQHQKVDGNLSTTLMDYDALDRLRSTLAPLTTSVSYHYDAQDNLAAIVDPLQRSTDYLHDGFDGLAETAGPDAGSIQHNYDAAGNRVISVDARGLRTTFRYDALNRLIAEEHSDTALDIRYGYDTGELGKGRLTSIEDASGSTALSWDARGNLIVQQRDSGYTRLSLAYQYDAADRLTGITYPSGRQVSYTRGVDGEVIEVTNTDSEGNSQRLASGISYLPFGAVNGMQYGNGLRYEASYDMGYRPVNLSLTNVDDWVYEYDSAGNVTRIDRTGGSTEYLYDPLNRLVRAGDGLEQLAYSYDANGNRDSISDGTTVDRYSYDQTSNRLLATENWRYEYDSNGNQVARITRLDESGDGLFYRYDDRNRLVAVSERITSGAGAGGEPQQLENVLVRYIYNASGQRASSITDDNTIDYLYDQAGHLLAEVRSDGLVLREYIYLNNQPVAVAQTSETELESRLGPEQILDNDGPATVAIGNWSNVRKKGAINDYYRRSDNAGNRYRWVPEGLNKAAYELYAWWPKVRKNNKKALLTIAHYGTNSSSVLNQSRNGKQWVYVGTYAFNGDGGEYIELSDEGGATAADAIRLIEIIPARVETRTAVYYIHNDHIGTPQRLTDQSGITVWQADYQPFGQASVNISAVDNPLRFPGQYYDAITGLHHNHFRDYDPVTGRYLQPDPIGLAGGLNPYSYVANNPLARSDPNGLCPWCVVGAGVGAGYEGLRQFHAGTLAVSGSSLGKIAVAGAAGALTGGFGAAVNQAGVKGLTAFLANAQFNVSNGLSAEIIAAVIDKRTLSGNDIYAILLGALGGSAVGSDAGLDELTSLVFAEMSEDGITSLVSEFQACADD